MPFLSQKKKINPVIHNCLSFMQGVPNWKTAGFKPSYAGNLLMHGQPTWLFSCYPKPHYKMHYIHGSGRETWVHNYAEREWGKMV